MTNPIKQIRSYISRIIDRWNLVPVNNITSNKGINDKAKFMNDENTFETGYIYLGKYTLLIRLALPVIEVIPNDTVSEK